MAKRHPSLVPLSHDHHHGLALAARLKQGDKALLNDGWTHDRKEQAGMVQTFYDRELRPHFKAEEEIVFPAMSASLPQTVSIIENLVRQHRQMESLVENLASGRGNALEHDLVALGELLEKHIRIEERELFEVFQSDLPADVAEEVGKSLRLMYRHD